MDKINSDNFVEMNAYTLEHRILVTGNTKANWEFFKAAVCLYDGAQPEGA